MRRNETRVATEPSEFVATDNIADVQRELERYVDAICARLPKWFCGMLVWLRRPSRWPVRIAVSLLLVIGGFLAFLPVLGLWMLPLGLIVISQDLPFLQGPLLRAVQWLDRRSRAWRRTHATGRDKK